MATWGELKKAGITWSELSKTTWGELKEFCTINPKAKQIPDDMEVSFVPMQRVSDTGDVQTDEIRKAADVKKGFTFFEEGDVLFPKITPCMENGKGGIARGLKNGVGFGSTEFHVLHPDPEKVSSEWLYYLTSWDEFRKQCARNMTGSAGQKRVPKSYLEQYKVFLPSLEEQRRIAALLDKVSDLIAKRRAQLDKLDLLVKSRFVEMFGQYIGKNEHALNTICSFIDYRGKTPEKSESGIPLITAKNVKQNLFCIDPQEFIPTENYNAVMTRGIPQVNDVLFTTEAPLGNVCRIPDVYDKFCVGQRIITMQPHKDIITSEYLEYALISKEFQDKMWQKSSGSTVKGIRSKLLEQLTIPVPPINQQQQFSKIVFKVEHSKVIIGQSLDKLETLKKALMQRYWG